MTKVKNVSTEERERVLSTVKPVLSGHSQKDQKLVFKTNYHLMQVKSIAEWSKWSILQNFRPSLRAIPEKNTWGGGGGGGAGRRHFFF